jgi:ATPase family associated with various cellular activities (AAA)
MEVAVSSLEVTTGKQAGGQVPPLGALCLALRRLDLLLDAATRAVQPSRAADGSPAFHGLFLTAEQVGRLLLRAPGAGEFRTPQRILADDLLEVSPGDSPLAWIAHAFGLSSFDVDLILIALAPEIDLRYEKIYGYLQDDITRKRPTVELALNLLCASPDEKLQRRAHLAAAAPLIKNGLLQLVLDANQPEPASLARYLRLDDGVTRLLLGQSGLDPRIGGFSELIDSTQPWDKLPIDPGILRALPQFISEAANGGNLRCFYFQGATRTDRREAAGALAKSVGLRLLSMQVDRMPEAARSEPPWKLLFREARMNGAVLYVSDLEDFRGAEANTARHALFDELRNQPGVTILAGTSAWIPNTTCEILPVVFATPDFAQRRVCWEHALQDLSLQADAADLDKMAARFTLSASQIVQATSSASINTKWRAAQASAAGESSPASSLHFSELSTAARNQCGHELSTLARKIEPRYGWNDIILPPDPKQQLREICQQAEYRDVVFGQWGFDRKLSLGKGLNVLFGGPPGTGKTMAAEVIAHELALDLYRIDLSQVVSKYIGETEKNLDRIFTAAEQSNAILFFDEADALFGKRSEVRDSHDRYANIEISYLLQKMEEYQGISILATNLRQNLDEAFVRRLQAIVEFPFPDEYHRRRIWENVFPSETPLGEDVKFDVLAREVRLAGGNIKNMALAAAFAAAAESSVIHLSHLIQAAHREHQKLARSWNPGALSKVLAAQA